MAVSARKRPTLAEASKPTAEALGSPGGVKGPIIGRAAAAGVRHAAIIMDGNGRWAKSRGLERSAGHRAGVGAARRAVEAARDAGLECLTLYSFSTENWRRPAGEVRDLLALLREFISADLPSLKENGVRVRVIGDRRNLDWELKALVASAQSQTERNDRLLLQIAFYYGGRDEILRAAQKAAEDAAAGALDPAALTEQAFSQYLDTGAAPDPDLVIRSSGEQRISNFLLWQAAYAEYVFLDVLWPDFDAAQFNAALDEFARRERRYGGTQSHP
ncbi:MAG: polyprenyl diphosphate synthase [Parvularculaceae bacterium]